MNDKNKNMDMFGFLSSVSCLQYVLSCFLLLLIQKEICGCPSVCQFCTGRQVKCHSLGLTTIPNNFPKTTTLLYLSGNNISNINMYELGNLHQLAVLYLDNAGVSNVHPKAFAHLKKLYYLYLNNNYIKHLDPGIFDGLFNLNYIYLQYNQIAFLPQGLFGDLLTVRHLTLEGNHLSFLGSSTFLGMISLHTLNLSKNMISRISNTAFYHILKLEHLYLEGNNLTQVPSNTFEKLKNLKRLFLSHNPIESIHPFAFRGLAALQHLFLENAKIKKICKSAFTGLTNLKHLILSNNNLHAVTSKTFRFLSNLKSLQLDRNKIASVEENAFENIGAFLKVLNLAHNNLGSLQPKVFQHLVSLTHLHASYNPWVCDCKLLGLYTWLRSSSLTVNIHCQHPPNLNGRPLRNVKRTEFEDCMSNSSTESLEVTFTSVFLTTVMAWFEPKTYTPHSQHQEIVTTKSATFTAKTLTSSTGPLPFGKYVANNPLETTIALQVQIPEQFIPANFTKEGKHVFTQDATPISLKTMFSQEQAEKLNEAFDILLALFIVACVVIMFLVIKVVQYRQKLKTIENAGENILEYYSCYQSASYNVSNPVQMPPQNLVRSRDSDQIRLLKPTLPESQAQVILFEHSVL